MTPTLGYLLALLVIVFVIDFTGSSELSVGDRVLVGGCG